MQLKKLLEAIDVLKIAGSQSLAIKDIVYDSRKVTPSSLFVCIKGQRTDGHFFIQDAISRGAKAAVVERWQDSLKGVTQIQVSSSREALADLSKTFFGNPSAQIKVIGVTGTNGKTTTTYLIQNMLELAGKKAGLIGTVEYRVGEKTLKPEMTTPESYDLQKFLSLIKKEKGEFAVMEVSSHAIDLKRVKGLTFNTLIFTNLSQEHLDWHKSVENYFRVKFRLFKENPEATWIINADDLYGRRIIEGAPFNEKVLTYGLGEANVRAEEIRISAENSCFKFVTQNNSFSVVTPLRGLFNVYNLLAAATVGINLGLPQKVIKKALENPPKVPGRFELIDEGQDFLVVIDYAHTPDSLRKVIEAARVITSGRIITIFGCGGDRDKSKRPLMGKVSGELSDFTIITSDNPRSEDPYDIILQIEKGIKEAPNSKYEKIVDRKSAIVKGISMAKKGDTVIIAGKGHERGQIFADRIVPFSDQEVAREILRKGKT